LGDAPIVLIGAPEPTNMEAISAAQNGG